MADAKKRDLERAAHGEACRIDDLARDTWDKSRPHRGGGSTFPNYRNGFRAGVACAEGVYRNGDKLKTRDEIEARIERTRSLIKERPGDSDWGAWHGEIYALEWAIGMKTEEPTGMLVEDDEMFRREYDASWEEHADRVYNDELFDPPADPGPPASEDE